MSETDDAVQSSALTRRDALKGAAVLGLAYLTAQERSEVAFGGSIDAGQARILELDQRPIALHPFTRMMMFDGVFVRSFLDGHAIMRVRIPHPGPGGVGPDQRYMQVVGVDASFPAAHVTRSPTVAALAAANWHNVYGRTPYVHLDFLVNVSGLPVGKHQFTIRSVWDDSPTPGGASNRAVEYHIRARIFVIDVTWDVPNLAGTAFVPEGIMRLQVAGVQLVQSDRILGRIPCDNKSWILPKDLRLRIDFAEPYAGTVSRFPFSDIAWKAVAAIIAIVAGLIAAVWWLGGQLGWWNSPVAHSESGLSDPTDEQACRSCNPGNYTYVSGDPVWGASFALAAGAGTAAYLSDVADPFLRGEEASPPPDGVRTSSETLSIRMNYKHLPMPGTPYQGTLDWNFRRQLTAGTAPAVERQDTVRNIHYLTCIRVGTADGQSQYQRAGTRNVVVRAHICGGDDTARYKQEADQHLRAMPPEFYVFGFLRHLETGRTKCVSFDPEPRTGIDQPFVGDFPIAADDPLGIWVIMVLVQNVNTANPRWTPRKQSEVVAGFLYHRNFNVTHVNAQGDCTIEPNWDLTIRLT